MDWQSYFVPSFFAGLHHYIDPIRQIDFNIYALVTNCVTLRHLFLVRNEGLAFIRIY